MGRQISDTNAFWSTIEKRTKKKETGIAPISFATRYRLLRNIQRTHWERTQWNRWRGPTMFGMRIGFSIIRFGEPSLSFSTTDPSEEMWRPLSQDRKAAPHRRPDICYVTRICYIYWKGPWAPWWREKKIRLMVVLFSWPYTISTKWMFGQTKRMGKGVEPYK